MMSDENIKLFRLLIIIDMTDRNKAFDECTQKIMDIRRMFEEDSPDQEEINRILTEEICPVICSDIHTAMVMFSAFHVALHEPEFMEVVYLAVFKYIEQNNLLSTNNNSKHDNIR
jgi:hypothetical protein